MSDRIVVCVRCCVRPTFADDGVCTECRNKKGAK